MLLRMLFPVRNFCLTSWYHPYSWGICAGACSHRTTYVENNYALYYLYLLYEEFILTCEYSISVCAGQRLHSLFTKHCYKVYCVRPSSQEETSLWKPKGEKSPGWSWACGDGFAASGWWVAVRREFASRGGRACSTFGSVLVVPNANVLDNAKSYIVGQILTTSP